MRKRLIAGNWKSNLHFNEAMSLVADLVDLEKNGKWNDADVAIMPPALYIRQTHEFLRNASSIIVLGAQDCSATEEGAFTGEISAGMLKAAGAAMVILGHSERRANQGEQNELLLTKLNRALKNGLKPIFCCGEHLEDRRKDEHFSVIKNQIDQTVLQLGAPDFSKIIVAYEPVWAIGTGETASPEQAQEMHSFIRRLVEEKFGKAIADQVRILYGGSMKPNNASTLLNQPDVDGGLIGGASLQVDDFAAIIEA